MVETSRVGRRGTIVIPAAIRHRLKIEEGAFVIVEEREDGVLIRPAALMPIEIYTAERRAEFLLSNAVDAEDYARAREEVRAMGLDPDAIPHYTAAGN
ncbi:SpoVT / AbrB like domain protein [Candidatus Methylomirabilis lanthanidiphila]|uniref:SpoVT / AbrB like domain protein n=1 Tax=Candidatus Methylomirabilis lanthanidiphila TaxID=2211376 RepID=A0A564ZHH9_9BACT|nr:SpoVT / AbrB like domain protein [Candidatus Methylomirabilis lanthanidiphila]